MSGTDFLKQHIANALAADVTTQGLPDLQRLISRVRGTIAQLEDTPANSPDYTADLKRFREALPKLEAKLTSGQA